MSSTLGGFAVMRPSDGYIRQLAHMVHAPREGVQLNCLKLQRVRVE